MDNIIQSTPIVLPSPRVDIAIRPATLDDLAFIDSLQKKTTKQVGWMPTKQFEGKIKAGHVLVACATSEQSAVGRGQQLVGGAQYAADSEGILLPTAHRPLHTIPVGYLIGNDQYFKRDDVGIIYQMNVLPEYRRSLVAASLLKAQFERSAYGCKLYCCWCAQDIDANHFWEAMGFVPLAYRTGGKGKVSSGQSAVDSEGNQLPTAHRTLPTPRVHIFWQKRIREGDESTGWWFPSKTDAGAIREDRIVLPIPPGVHWSEVQPLILPRQELASDNGQLTEKTKTKREKKPVVVAAPAAKKGTAVSARGALRFSLPTPQKPEVMDKPKPVKRTKVKADPRMISAARELRDRWLERINETPILPSAKYEVCRQISESPRSMPLLAA